MKTYIKVVVFFIAMICLGGNLMSETLVLGGGCFWCLEAAFETVNGVKSVESGYSGGDFPNPSYEAVCSGDTGHIEVVKISYDPSVCKLDELFDLFFKIHDPTSKDRQGADSGVQYRSVVFYASEAQKKAIESYIKAHSKDFAKAIVTEVRPLDIFYKAEEYHQNYFKKNPDFAYCKLVITPKLKKAGL